MWVLIVMAYAGAFSDSDSVALTNVRGFNSAQTCRAAATQVTGLANGTKKVVRATCVEVK
jgi:hypothetical protein